MNTQPLRHKTGFTLLEIILTLVLLGVVGALMAPYYGAGVLTSSTPLFRVQDTVQLEAVMENIIADVKSTCSNGETDASGNCISQDLGYCNAGALKTEGLGGIYTKITSNFASNYNAGGYSITAAVVVGQMSTSISPALPTGSDQNCAMTVTLTHTSGQALTYVFPEGTNY